MILLQPSLENTIYDRLVLTELKLQDKILITKIIIEMHELSVKKEKNLVPKVQIIET